jgi:Aldo/keto reductase family
MQTRLLGSTALTVSRLGLGLAALGRPGYINLGHAQDLQANYGAAGMEAHCHTVLDAAWQLGVRYFDAARSYGQAEAFLSRWLSRPARNGATPIPRTGRSKPGSTRSRIIPLPLCNDSRPRARSSSAPTSSSIRFTRPLWRVACCKIVPCWMNWRGCATAACASA